MDAYRPENASNREAFHVTELLAVLFEQYCSTVEIKKALKMNE
ncbi:MAG: hypothetical protein Q4C57_11270 [Bacillota bacterium]|nr:hypothetical protein [Bacillota bacterium]